MKNQPILPVNKAYWYVFVISEFEIWIITSAEQKKQDQNPGGNRLLKERKRTFWLHSLCQFVCFFSKEQLYL